jgi:Mg-chelatase subunit ChlD
MTNWERVLDDIEPYLYGGTQMCQALWTLMPLFTDSRYTSKVQVLISDGDATDGRPLPAAQVLRTAGETISACLLTDTAIKEPRRLRGVDEIDKS